MRDLLHSASRNTPEEQAAAWQQLIHALLASNEFLFRL